jgi:hypothetical protein
MLLEGGGAEVGVQNSNNEMIAVPKKDLEEEKKGGDSKDFLIDSNTFIIDKKGKVTHDYEIH